MFKIGNKVRIKKEQPKERKIPIHPYHYGAEGVLQENPYSDKKKYPWRVKYVAPWNLIIMGIPVNDDEIELIV